MQRCEHLSKEMFTFSRVYEHWQKTICKLPQRCEQLSKNMLTFSRVFEQVDDFLRYCWTKFLFYIYIYMCFTTFSEALRTPRTETCTIEGFRAQPPGKPVRMRMKTAAEVRTFVKKYVNFLTSLCTLVRINLQTATEVRTFVEKYVNFLTSFWTGRRFSAILLNRVFALYVFYHVLRSAPYPADGQTDRRTDGQLKASGLGLLASQFVWEYIYIYTRTFGRTCARPRF